jgi:hypothetical protein
VSGPWDVLGIEPTGDVAAIRKAYARRLKEIKRDLEPRAFQALREAYERALAMAGANEAAPSASAVRETAAPPASPPPDANEPAARPERFAIADAPPPAARQRWKDVVGPRGEEPPPGQRRMGDRAAPAPATGHDDRARVGQALAAIESALSAPQSDAAARAFDASHDALSHPVDGVSIAALVAFERQVLRLVTAHLGKGEAAAALARTAARRLKWAERVAEWDDRADVLADSIKGFIAAEEVARFAQAEPGARCPVSRDFARDLTGPLHPVAFTLSILTRKGYRTRRAELSALESAQGRPLTWITGPSVAWWRRAMSVPRLFPNVAVSYLALAFICAVPLVAQLCGVKDSVAFASAALLALAAAAVLFPVGLLQDAAALAFLHPVWAGGARVMRFLERRWNVARASFPIGPYFVYPFFGAAFFAAAMRVFAEDPSVKTPVGLLALFGVCLVVGYGWAAMAIGRDLLQHGVQRVVHATKRPSLSATQRTLLIWFFIVMAAIWAALIVGLNESDDGVDDLVALRDGIAAALVVFVLAAGAYRVTVLVRRRKR